MMELFILRASPAQSLLTISKCLHLDRFAIADRIDIRKANIVPFAATLGANMGMHKHNDAVAGHNKPFRLTAAFCQAGPRLREIALRSVASVVCAAPGELCRFGPLDLRIKGLHGGINIASIKSCVRSAKSGDYLLMLRWEFHSSLRGRISTSVQVETRCNDDKDQGMNSDHVGKVSVPFKLSDSNLPNNGSAAADPATNQEESTLTRLRNQRGLFKVHTAQDRAVVFGSFSGEKTTRAEIARDEQR